MLLIFLDLDFFLIQPQNYIDMYVLKASRESNLHVSELNTTLQQKKIVIARVYVSFFYLY